MKVLAIGCHPDDLEIACGGTLRKYVEEGADVYMCHVECRSVLAGCIKRSCTDRSNRTGCFP